MTENSTIKIFQFPVFRYMRLFYSVPFFFASIFAYVRLASLWSFDQPGLPWWLAGLIIPWVFIVIWGAATVILFYWLNTQVILVTADNEGFQLQLPRNRKIRWSEVKSCNTPMDYAPVSGQRHEGTIIALGFGFMKKPKIIRCSTWTILNKAKRKHYEQQFKEFKALVQRHCQPSYSTF